MTAHICLAPVPAPAASSASVAAATTQGPIKLSADFHIVPHTHTHTYTMSCTRLAPWIFIILRAGEAANAFFISPACPVGRD